jgi:regulator of replication initiation timing
MAIKWSKINRELIIRLRKSAKFLFDDGDYIGASVIEMVFLEGTLSLATRLQLLKKGVPLEKAPEFMERYSSFIDLIKYFFLLTQDQYLYDEIKDINRQRNKMIHELLEFKTFDELQQEARHLYLKAESLEEYLVNNYFEEKFKKKEKGLTVKELQTQIDALLAQLGSLQKQLSKLGG